jgi:hypothetical protein
MYKIETLMLESNTEFIQYDDKARRRLNVSTKPAGISGEEIQKGVTSEQLLAIKVPVFFYKTQITIHGKLPDVGDGQVLTYKCLIKNQNGSVGVRYIAIDGEKKERVEHFLNWCPLNTKKKHVVDGYWHLYKTSQDVWAQTYFGRLEDMKAVYTSLSKTIKGMGMLRLLAGKTLMGGYVLQIYLDAIPEEYVKPLCGALVGLAKPKDIDNAIASAKEAEIIHDKRWEAERAASLARWKKEEEAAAAKEKAAKELLQRYQSDNPQYTWITSMPRSTGAWAWEYAYVNNKREVVIGKVAFEKRICFGKENYKIISSENIPLFAEKYDQPKQWKIVLFFSDGIKAGAFFVKGVATIPTPEQPKAVPMKKTAVANVYTEVLKVGSGAKDLVKTGCGATVTKETEKAVHLQLSKGVVNDWGRMWVPKKSYKIEDGFLYLANWLASKQSPAMLF